MRYFTDSILLLLYSTLTFFYVPADQALVFALLFAVILCCITYLCRVCKTESCSHNSLPVLKPAGNIIPVLAGSYVIFGLCSLWFSDFLLFFLRQPLKSFRRHLLLPLFLSVQAASPPRVRRLTDSLLNLLFLSRSPAYHTHLLCLFPCYKPPGRRTEAVPASGSSPQPDRRRLQALSPASSCPPYQMPDSSGSSQ